MGTTYQMVIIGRGGMYTYGRRAASPALARLAVGNLIRQGPDLLGIERTDWLGDDQRHTVLVEAEDRPGEWAIGPRERRAP